MKGRRTFRPSPWAVVGTLVGCAVTIYLGIWQLGRGRAKQHLQQEYAVAAKGPSIALRGDTPAPPDLRAIAAEADGSYDSARQLLLDNQVRERIPGYRVWTPLHLTNGATVVVDRGWVVQNPDRRVLPPITVPTDLRHVQGLWRSLPEPGLRLANDNCQQQAAWPKVVQYPTVADLRCLYGAGVAPGLLLLDAADPLGFVREWTVPDVGFPPERHFAYAAQWFTFAATLLVSFVVLNFKRRPSLDAPPDRP